MKLCRIMISVRLKDRLHNFICYRQMYIHSFKKLRDVHCSWRWFSSYLILSGSSTLMVRLEILRPICVYFIYSLKRMINYCIKSQSSCRKIDNTDIFKNIFFFNFLNWKIISYPDLYIKWSFDAYIYTKV